LAGKIQKGGVGTWGQIPMPPNDVTADEAKTLATWVLSLK
jgi:cytochrome c